MMSYDLKTQWKVGYVTWGLGNTIVWILLPIYDSDDLNNKYLSLITYLSTQY